MTREQAELLKEPWPDEALGCVPISGSRQNIPGWLTLKAFLPAELIEDRLDMVDPQWAFDIREIREVRETPETELTYVVIGELTACGVTRIGVGSDRDIRGAVTYAFKSAAKSLGVGRFIGSDARYMMQAYIKTDKEYNQLVYSHPSWAKALEMIGQSQTAPKEAKPTPKATPKPTKPSAKANGPNAWQMGLRRVIEAKGLTEDHVLSMAIAAGIIDSQVDSIDQLTLVQANAVLQLIRSNGAQEAE